MSCSTRATRVLSTSPSPPSTLRYLAYTSGQFIAWVGTDYDGAGLRTELITLNAINQTQSPEIGRLSLYIGASHIVGIEATGTTLWLAGAGSGNPALDGGTAHRRSSR